MRAGGFGHAVVQNVLVKLISDISYFPVIFFQLEIKALAILGNRSGSGFVSVLRFLVEGCAV